MNIYVHSLGMADFSKNDDESKSVQNRWQLNEFLQNRSCYWRNIIISFHIPQLRTLTVLLTKDAADIGCKRIQENYRHRQKGVLSFTNFSSLTIPLSYLVLFTRASGAEEGGALPTWAITLHTHFNHNPFRMIKMKSNVIYNLEHCSQSFLNITAAM